MSYLDLIEIHDHKIEYNNTDDNRFEPRVDDYITIAKKVIAEFGGVVAKEMLSSDDVVSNVATHIMMADWRWSKDYRSKKGTVRTQYAYRNQCAIWAIKGYISRKHKKYRPMISLNKHVNDHQHGKELSSFIEDKRNIGTKDMETIEQTNYTRDRLEKLLSCKGLLTNQQANFIHQHYLEQKSMPDIARSNSISRQAVADIIKRGLTKLREMAT